MDLPAHTVQRIAEIRDLHQPIRQWIRRRWLPRPVDVCILCRQTYPCRQIVWSDDVEAGRISPAGWRPWAG